MEDLIPPKVNILVVLTRLFIRVGMIDVKNLSLIIPVDLHVLRKQRIQSKDAVLAIPDDLRIAVSP